MTKCSNHVQSKRNYKKRAALVSIIGAASAIVALSVEAKQQDRPAPGATTFPAISLEQRASLRCAAAFALVSKGQEVGNQKALEYPALEKRGREYFVRSAAQIMDETKLTREQVANIIQNEAQSILDEDKIEELMPACMMSLSSSGL